MIRLAVIGMGFRVSHMIGQLREVHPDIKVVAISDPAEAAIRERLQGKNMPDSDGVKFYDTADRLLEYADQYDAVVIGTRCHLHTPMAVKVAPTGLPLFLEKPVAITREQVAALATAFRGREDTVVVSFPLRATPLFAAALEIARSGRLGTINQVQAFNNVPYGGVYFGNWYRNYDEVGGLWLQKATHDFDYINLLINDRPTAIAATITRKIYVGDMPHDLTCSRCDRTEACMESPKNLKRRGDGGGMEMEDHPCAFSREIRNEDAGSAIIQYSGGGGGISGGGGERRNGFGAAHACYSQNFITRKAAGRRGAIVTGYSATMEFDWLTDRIRVVDHHSANRVDDIEVKASSGYMGGDYVLAEMFIDVVLGRAKSRSTLRDGMLSAAMCLAARESSHTNTFQPIPTVDELPQLLDAPSPSAAMV